MIRYSDLNRPTGRGPAAEPDSGPLYLTTREVARRLGISTRTLERMRADGMGPSYMVVSAGCVRYPLAQLESWEDERTIDHAQAVRNIGGTA